MGNPFNFSQGIQGESNDQIYNAQLAQMGQNDLARAQGLNQLSQRDLNAQLFGFKQDQYTNPNAGLTTEQQLVQANLAGVDAATIGQARDNRLQNAALYGKQDLQNNAHAFNKSSAIYDQTSTGTRINNYDGSQRMSALDKAKAFDFNQQGRSRGASAGAPPKPYTPAEMKVLNAGIANPEGGASQQMIDALFPQTEGANIDPNAMAYAQSRLQELAASGMQASEIYKTIYSELGQGLKYDDGGYFGSESTVFTPPVLNPATGETQADTYANMNIPASAMQGMRLIAP